MEHFVGYQRTHFSIEPEQNKIAGRSDALEDPFSVAAAAMVGLAALPTAEWQGGGGKTPTPQTTKGKRGPAPTADWPSVLHHRRLQLQLLLLHQGQLPELDDAVWGMGGGQNGKACVGGGGVDSTHHGNFTYFSTRCQRGQEIIFEN